MVVSPPPVSADLDTVSPPTSRRKFPPLCWNHEESVALIEVCRQKWFSLRRSSLRSHDWESVAADVARRCPLVPFPKSSIQCRHKMDKLRKRYREEKQRALAYPDRFFTSWVLFHLMDSLENDRSSFFSTNAQYNSSRITGIKRKFSGHHLGTVPSPRSSSRTKLYGKAASSAFDSDNHEEMDKGWDDTPVYLKAPEHDCIKGLVTLPKRIGSKHGDENSSLTCGFPVSTSGDRISSQPCSVSKDRVEVECSGAKAEGFVFPAKNLGDAGHYFMSAGFNLKNYRELDGSSHSGEFEKKRRTRNYQSERSDKSVADFCSSVKTVGEELLKLEKIKMEMTKQIEKRRMKLEMKHTKSILQLQLQIVDSFAEALLERERKIGALVSPES